jgi:hypothetical protein
MRNLDGTAMSDILRAARRGGKQVQAEPRSR